MTAVSFSTIAQPNPGRGPSTAKLRPAFDGFSFSRRKESVETVTSAKRPGTRAARISKIVGQVRTKAKAVSSK